MHSIRLAMATLALSAAGCSMTTPFGPVGQLAAPAPPGPTYHGGYGSQLFPPSENFLAQTREAMDDIGMHSINERHEGAKTILEAKTVNGRRAHVEIKPESRGNRVATRFGPLGDEPLSRAFLDRMSARLGTVKPTDEASATSRDESVDKAATFVAPRPKVNRAYQQPGTIVDRQLAGGYRDSLSP
jgi:hypothetical protein